MRKFFKQTMILAAMFLTAATAIAQSDGFSYQAVVRDSEGALVADANVGLRVTLTDETGAQLMYCRRIPPRLTAMACWR